MPSNPPSFPELYEQALVGPLFRPWAELTLEEVALARRERLLDVACGTGIVARLGKERGGASVVGVDVNAAMLAVARAVAPAIDWREADAASLPLRDGENFDVVVCQQGLQFFADRAAAVREMHRALTPGGRLAVSTWRPDEELPFVRELRRIAERRLGPIADRRHCFGDAAALEALLRAAGLADVRSRTVSRTMRFADGSVFARLNAVALVAMSAGAKAMSGEERERMVDAIARDSAEAVQASSDEKGLAFELAANVATAKRS